MKYMGGITKRHRAIELLAFLRQIEASLPSRGWTFTSVSIPQSRHKTQNGFETGSYDAHVFIFTLLATSALPG